MDTIARFFDVVKHPCVYVILVIAGTLFIRLILNIFKAWAIVNGEVDEIWEEESKKLSSLGFFRILGYSFFSSGKCFKIDDCWIPALIGFYELFLFPLLMLKGLWLVIGGWITIKTASSWGGWQKTRTAYNRFLLGNLLSLTVSVLIAIFVKVG